MLTTMKKDLKKAQEYLREAFRERDKEIRRQCDDARSQGKAPNYAAIGRRYNLSRERIRQIDNER
jgi:DNA-directed RNA polymerase sigma subunit (sigma70/sigma32)